VGRRKSNGLAGPGSLVRYGDEVKNCSAVKMQFDAGSGTVGTSTRKAGRRGGAAFSAKGVKLFFSNYASLIQLAWPALPPTLQNHKLAISIAGTSRGTSGHASVSMVATISPASDLGSRVGFFIRNGTSQT